MFSRFKRIRRELRWRWESLIWSDRLIQNRKFGSFRRCRIFDIKMWYPNSFQGCQKFRNKWENTNCLAEWKRRVFPIRSSLAKYYWFTAQSSKFHMKLRKKFNPHTLVAQKIADEVIFEVTSLTPRPSNFWCAFFGKSQVSPSRFHFRVSLYIRIMFWVRWFYS